MLHSANICEKVYTCLLISEHVTTKLKVWKTITENECVHLFGWTFFITILLSVLTIIASNTYTI